MKCYICQTPFGEDGTDCPGCCTHEFCLTAIEMPGTWEEFLRAKESHILAKMRDAPGRPYIHVLPRQSGQSGN